MVAVVKEFYANALEAKNKVAIVRGKLMPFDSVAINTYYQLASIEDDEFTYYRQEELD